MRKLILAAALILAGVFFISHFTEVEKAANTLRNGDWRFVVLAILFEVLWLWGMGKTYQSIYRLLGIQEDHKHMLSVAAAANFASVVAPSGGMSALAVFMADAKRRGHPVARITVAGAMYLLLEYTSILLAFGVGIIALLRRNNLHWPELTAAGILLAGALGLMALLIIASRSAQLFARVMAWLARTCNRLLRPFLQREWWAEDQALAFALEASGCITLMRKASRTQLARPLAFSLSNKVLLIGILVLVFMAFQVPFSAGTIVAGFSLAYLYVIVSPTPAGVGVVEGVLTLSLRSLGVPLEPAAVITLAFRGVTFWEPLFIGGVMFRRVNGKKEEIMNDG